MTDRDAEPGAVPTEQDMEIDPAALNEGERTPLEEARALLADTTHDEEERLEAAGEGP